MRKEDKGIPNTELCANLISDENFKKAIKKVRSNKGAPGIDNVPVNILNCTENELNEKVKLFDESRSRIVARTYRPKPTKRVEIPKDDGGKRLLGLPTVQDKVVQQAMVQVLSPIFEETFSDSSYGYRPNRSAQDAVRQAQIYAAEGYKYVVDLDLSKFFDNVNHDILMSLIDKTLVDKDIRRLIYSFLKAGVMVGGFQEATEKGTPQGGVISPLLSNIYLTPFDKDLDKRGIKHIRYCDDCMLFAKSEMASRRMKANAIKFLEKKLRVKVNEQKTESRKVYGAQFLGFKFLNYGKQENGIISNAASCVVREKSWIKLKMKIREVTKRNRGVSLEQVVLEVNRIITGWINYYALANIKLKIQKLMRWTRMKIRLYAYKIWKTGRNRKHQLRLLGVPEYQLKKFGFTSNRYWKEALILGTCLTNKIMHQRKNKVVKNSINLINGDSLYIVRHTLAQIEERKAVYEQRRKHIIVIGLPSFKACDGKMYWLK